MRKFLLVLSAFAFALSAFAQERTISGKVTSAEDGGGLPGVNVVLKGTSNGTVTDADGNYKLSVPSTGGTLVFSFIGYATQEVAIGERSVVDAGLASDVQQLTEVVVTAQSIQQDKRALGYSVTSVGGNMVAQKPEADLGRLLQGKIPGVNITNTGGVSGTGTNIVIRGYTSITGNKQPLWIVDGVPFNSSTNAQGDFLSGNQATPSRFLDLDPNNIERIDVLKGLSAAVLYGEQGRNGVMIVTTKNARKKKERFEVNVNQTYFVTEIASMPELQNNYGNGFDQNWGFFFSNWGPKFGGLNAPDSIPNPVTNTNATKNEFPELLGTKVPYQAYPNNVRDFFKQGFSANTSLNVSGGNETMSYNASLSYLEDQGFIPNNTLQKLNFGIGFNAQVTEKFNVSTSFNYAATDQKTPPISAATGNSTAGAGSSVFANVFFVPRNIDLMGLPFETPTTHMSAYYRAGNDLENPRWTAKYSSSTNDVRRFFGRTAFSYKIMEGLDITYRIGLDTYTEYQQYKINKGGPQNINGLYRTVTGQNTIWNHDIFVSYNKDLNEDFNLNFTVGMQNRQDNYTQDGMESAQQVVFGFMNHSNFLTHNNINSFTGANLNYQEKVQLYGYYGTATLGYKDYAYLNFQGRYDQKSTVEKANQGIFYPSVSLSFIPTTAFGFESDQINQIKVRLNYGTSAGYPNPYGTRNVLVSNPRSFLATSGQPVVSNTLSNRLGNPNLRPELFSEIEFGIEGSFLKNRLGIDLSMYSRATKDLITDTPLDPSTGYTVTRINVGESSTKGIELSLRGTPIKMGGFQWDVTLNWWAYRSTIDKLGSGLTRVQIPGGGFQDLGNYAVPGEPYNVIYGSYVPRDPVSGGRIVDAAGNYLYSDDIRRIGDPNPMWNASLFNTFMYKGFTLSAQMEYRQGGDIWSTTALALIGRGVSKFVDFDHDRTFTLPGVKQNPAYTPTNGEKEYIPNDIQITSAAVYFNNVAFGPSELQVYDGTTIRLRDISLNYDLPQSLIQKTPFKRVTVGVSGQNLWFKALNFPKELNFDTDVLSTGVGNGLGFDMFTGPSARRFGGMIRLTF
ncbi:MAG: SusC/RagA family TonB-linked outer membrane protein [Cyclobacteriaceae bacterium]|nr:SusC/RagA family TonB-linked outer membrane protein [Cyclobacteriaceae bacterium]